MTYFLLAEEGRHYRSVSSAESKEELVDFAKMARVTGIITQEILAVDFSGEGKTFIPEHVQEAFENLIKEKA